MSKTVMDYLNHINEEIKKFDIPEYPFNDLKIEKMKLLQGYNVNHLYINDNPNEIPDYNTQLKRFLAYPATDYLTNYKYCLLNGNGINENYEILYNKNSTDKKIYEIISNDNIKIYGFWGNNINEYRELENYYYMRLNFEEPSKDFYTNLNIPYIPDNKMGIRGKNVKNVYDKSKVNSIQDFNGKIYSKEDFFKIFGNYIVAINDITKSYLKNTSQNKFYKYTSDNSDCVDIRIITPIDNDNNIITRRNNYNQYREKSFNPYKLLLTSYDRNVSLVVYDGYGVVTGDDYYINPDTHETERGYYFNYKNITSFFLYNTIFSGLMITNDLKYINKEDIENQYDIQTPCFKLIPPLDNSYYTKFNEYENLNYDKFNEYSIRPQGESLYFENDYTIEERTFKIIYEGEDNPLYATLYNPFELEEYLNCFNIPYVYLYDIDYPSTGFNQGQKVRHHSLVNQDGTQLIKKVRHHSLVNQDGTQLIKKVRHRSLIN